MPSPAISLIITVYNREHYLAATIESILTQTYSNFELLIWDDGSNDQFVLIARDYAKKDSRIQVYAAAHQGHALALKAAHDRARGQYLGWVDSDDLLAPTTLAETAAILDTQPKVGMVYTDYQVMDEMGKVKGLGNRCQIPYSKDQLLLDFMTFHFRLFRREVFEQVGGIDPDFNLSGVDYDLCLRLSEVTEIYHLQRPLYYYRNHAKNISHQRRYEQIMNAKMAISRALKRRGLDQKYQIEVQIQSRFFLQKKQ